MVFTGIVEVIPRAVFFSSLRDGKLPDFLYLTDVLLEVDGSMVRISGL